MSFYGPSRHLQLAGDFRIITTLQKQFDNLLFARAKPNSLFVHRFPPFFFLSLIAIAHWGRSLPFPIAHTLPSSTGECL